MAVILGQEDEAGELWTEESSGYSLTCLKINKYQSKIYFFLNYANSTLKSKLDRFYTPPRHKAHSVTKLFSQLAAVRW